MTDQPRDRLAAALRAPESSTRLKAAMAAGTSPHPDYLEPLVERCAVEPDFFVRDMLTWALTRLEPGATVDRLLVELTRRGTGAEPGGAHPLEDRRPEGLPGDHPRAPPRRRVEVRAGRLARGRPASPPPRGSRPSSPMILPTQFGRGRSRDAPESQPSVRHAGRRGAQRRLGGAVPPRTRRSPPTLSRPSRILEDEGLGVGHGDQSTTAGGCARCRRGGRRARRRPPASDAGSRV